MFASLWKWTLIFIVLLIGTDLPIYGEGIKFSSQDAPYQGVREREVDIIHQKVNLRLYPKLKKVEATTYIEFKPLADRSHFSLDQKGLDIKKVTYKGRNLRFRLAHQGMTIFAPTVWKKGKTYKISISYQTTPRRGLYFVSTDPKGHTRIYAHGSQSEHQFWIPCYAGPNDFASWEMVIVVPRGMKAIANGRLVKTTTGKKLTTYHWHEKTPFPTYLLTLWVGGTNTVTYRQKHGDLDIIHYGPKKYADRLKPSYEEVPEIIGYFEKHLGVKYPYGKYANLYIHDYPWGNMQFAGGTVYGMMEFYDRRASLDFPMRAYVGHNVGHSWIGNLVGLESWADMWLNEGFGVCLGLLYEGDKRGAEPYYILQENLMDCYVGEGYFRPVVDYHFDTDQQLWDAHSYDKGGLVLHMMRHRVGPKQFWKILSEYTKTYRGRAVSTHHFRKIVEKVTGRSWNRFFHQWLYSAGHPILQVKPVYNKKGKQLAVTVAQTQKWKPFTFPLDIYVHTGKGIEKHTVTFRKRRETHVLPVSSRPTLVEIDPHWGLLAQYKIDKPIYQWIYQLRRGSSVASKVRAAKALGKFGKSTSARRALLAAVKNHPLWTVRRQTVLSLQVFFGQKGVETRILKALDDKESRVVQGAVQVLVAKKSKQVWPHLVKLLATSKSYWSRIAAAQGLHKLDEKKGAPLLINALKYKSHDDLLGRTILGLLGAKPDESRFLLFKKYSHPRRPQYIRCVALGQLAKLGRHAPTVREEVFQILKRELASDRISTGWHHFSLRMAVIHGFATLGDKRAIPLLKSYLRQPFLLYEIDRDLKGAIKKLEGKKKATTKAKSSDRLNRLEKRVAKTWKRAKEAKSYAKKAKDKAKRAKKKVDDVKKKVEKMRKKIDRLEKAMDKLLKERKKDRRNKILNDDLKEKARKRLEELIEKERKKLENKGEK